MVRAFQTGVYSMSEIADDFGIHHATASRRAVSRLASLQGSLAGLKDAGLQDLTLFWLPG